MSHMSISERVVVSIQVKWLVLAINEIYKKTNDFALMDAMKPIIV